MKHKILQAIGVGAALFALSLLFATSAFAGPHVTNGFAQSDTLTVGSIVSTGDAGSLHGNLNLGTSPVLPTPASGFYGWLNQPVTFGDLTIIDPSDNTTEVAIEGSFYQASMTSDFSAATKMPFDDAATVGGEGLYSVTATGTEEGAPDTVVTGTVEPAFGIDMTRPTSSSDATEAYAGGTATINIAATDSLSGVQDVRTSLDSGPWDYEFDGTSGETDAQVVTSVLGPHTLTWQVFDNAGNLESHVVSFIVYSGSTVDIAASAGPNGQISPSGTVAATINADRAFAITPDPNYYVLNVIVDGQSVGPVTSYTFTHVTVPHTISASFAPLSATKLTVSGPSRAKSGYAFQLSGALLPPKLPLQIARYRKDSKGKWHSYGRYNQVGRANGTWIANVSTNKKGSWKFVITAGSLSVTKYVTAY